jgi:hypothetical protein
MTLWTPGQHYPRLFSSTHDIAVMHAEERLRTNERRRAHQIEVLQNQVVKLRNEARFVQLVMDEPMFLMRQKRADVIARLEADEFQSVDQGYQYLLRLPADSFTEETLLKTRDQLQKTEADLAEWQAKTACDIWTQDLDRLELAYTEFLVRRLERRQGPDAAPRKRPAATEPKKVPRKRTKKTLEAPEFQFFKQ